MRKSACFASATHFVPGKITPFVPWSSTRANPYNLGVIIGILLIFVSSYNVVTTSNVSNLIHAIGSIWTLYSDSIVFSKASSVSTTHSENNNFHAASNHETKSHFVSRSLYFFSIASFILSNILIKYWLVLYFLEENISRIKFTIRCLSLLCNIKR